MAFNTLCIAFVNLFFPPTTPLRADQFCIHLDPISPFWCTAVHFHYLAVRYHRASLAPVAFAADLLSLNRIRYFSVLTHSVAVFRAFFASGTSVLRSHLHCFIPIKFNGGLSIIHWHRWIGSHQTMSETASTLSSNEKRGERFRSSLGGTGNLERRFEANVYFYMYIYIIYIYCVLGCYSDSAWRLSLWLLYMNTDAIYFSDFCFTCTLTSFVCVVSPKVLNVHLERKLYLFSYV